MGKKTGPKSMLTRKLKGFIRSHYLDCGSLRETSIKVFNNLDKFKNLEGEERAKELANFIQKIYNWKSWNTLNLGDAVETWKLEYKLRLANNNITRFLKMKETSDILSKDGDIYTIDDTNKLRVKADISKFVAKTLGKEHYSERNEFTGKEGTPLYIPSELIDKYDITREAKADSKVGE